MAIGDLAAMVLAIFNTPVLRNQRLSNFNIQETMRKNYSDTFQHGCFAFENRRHESSSIRFIGRHTASSVAQLAQQ
jgi:hypothetical protein